MRAIGKQNSFNFIELASEPQIHWILLGKEFPWDSYFDVLSIQSISGRQKSILSLSLFRSLSLQTQKASQKVVSAESMKQLFFSFSLFPWDPKTCQYHPRKPHGRVRTFFFLSFFVMHWITSKSRLFPIFFLQSSEYLLMPKMVTDVLFWILMKKSLVFMAFTDGFWISLLRHEEWWKKFWLENISLQAKSFEYHGKNPGSFHDGNAKQK